MNWVFLAVISAALQAVGLVIKKHALRVGGMNDIVAFFVFASAGIVLATIYWLLHGMLLQESVFSLRLWWDIFVATFFTILGVVFSYRALDMADVSYLSPYSVCGVFVTAIIAFFIVGEIPTAWQFVGMSIIALGSIVMEYRAHNNLSHADRQKISRNRAALVLFFTSVFFYSIPPAWQKDAVLVTEDALFVAYVTHVAIAIAFVIIVLVRGGFRRMNDVAHTMPAQHFVLWTVAAGVVAAGANGSAYIAFVSGPVAPIIALKRLAPLFTFLLGVYIFHESLHLRRKLLATILMVCGAILVALG